MATREELIARARNFKRDGFDPGNIGAGQRVADALSDTFGGSLSAGEGWLQSLAEVADRPGRGFRHLLLRQDPEQAASAFLPKFLSDELGLPESQPYFTEDFLDENDLVPRQQLIPEDVPILGGIDARDLAGFAGDVVLDPIGNMLLPFAGRAAKSVIKAGGRATAAGISRLGQAGIPLLSGAARGTEALGRGFGNLFIRDFDLSKYGSSLKSSILRIFGEAEEDAAKLELSAALQADKIQKAVGEHGAKQLSRLVEPLGSQNEMLVKFGAEEGAIRAAGREGLEQPSALLPKPIVEGIEVPTGPQFGELGATPTVAGEGLEVFIRDEAIDIASSKPQKTTFTGSELGVGPYSSALDDEGRISGVGHTTARLSPEDSRILDISEHTVSGEEAKKLAIVLHGSEAKFKKSIDEAIDKIQDEMPDARRAGNMDNIDDLQARLEEAMSARVYGNASVRAYMRNSEFHNLPWIAGAEEAAKTLGYKIFTDNDYGRGIFAVSDAKFNVLTNTETKLMQTASIFQGPIRQGVARVRPADGIVDDIANLSPEMEKGAKLYMLGEAGSPIPGKRGIGGVPENVLDGIEGVEGNFIDWGVITEAHRVALAKRLGIDHVMHASTTDGLVRSIIDRLDDITGTSAKGGAAPTARSIIDAGRELANRSAFGAKASMARKLVGTIDEINEAAGREVFDANLARISFGESQRWISVKTTRDAMGAMSKLPEIFRKLDDAADIPLGWKAIPKQFIARELVGPAGAAVPEEIYKRMFGRNGIAQKWGNPELIQNPLIRGIKAFNNYFRSFTVGVPMTILRDVASDTYMNILAGMRNIPGWVANSFKVKNEYAKFIRDGVTSGTFRLGGKSIPKEVVFDSITRHRVLGNSMLHTELGQTTHNFLNKPKGGWRLLNAVDPKEFFITRGSHAAKRYLQDNSRLAHFLWRLSQGDSAIDASLSMKKFLFDRSGLTDFEFNVVREVFPFYSWARQNIPRQIMSLFDSPQVVQKVLGLKFKLDHENRANVPDEALQLWLSGQLTLPVKRNGKNLEIFALNNWLPIADLTEVDSPRKFIRFAMNNLNPVVKEAISQSFNWDFFFRRAIERYEGEQESFMGATVSKKFGHLVRNARLINELDRAVLPIMAQYWPEQFGWLKPTYERTSDMLGNLTPWQAAFRALGGIKIRPIDLEKNREYRLKELKRELSLARGGLKRASDNNDQSGINRMSYRMDQLESDIDLLKGLDFENYAPTARYYLEDRTD